MRGTTSAAVSRRPIVRRGEAEPVPTVAVEDRPDPIERSKAQLFAKVRPDWRSRNGGHPALRIPPLVDPALALFDGADRLSLNNQQEKDPVRY